MKHSIFLITLLIISLGALAQTDVQVWNKWSSKKDTLILFNGGNNVIQIYSPTYKPAEIKIKSLDKALRIGLPEVKGDTTIVMAMPFPDKGKTMRLAIQNKKTGKEIRTVNFVSDSIPQLMACIGKIQSAEAQKKDLLIQTSLRLYFPKSLYSYPYTIKSYTFKISGSTGSATIGVAGSFISKEVLAQINSAASGAMITITDIKATCPDCATRTLPDIKLKIK